MQSRRFAPSCWLCVSGEIAPQEACPPFHCATCSRILPRWWWRAQQFWMVVVSRRCHNLLVCLGRAPQPWGATVVKSHQMTESGRAPWRELLKCVCVCACARASNWLGNFEPLRAMPPPIAVMLRRQEPRSCVHNNIYIYKEILYITIYKYGS